MIPEDRGVNMCGKVVAVCSSEKRGGRKQPVAVGELRQDHGLAGDAHAGEWHRQLSLLARESIDKMRRIGFDVAAGDFAENITTSGLDLHLLSLGTRLMIGPALLEITQIGKECHTPCAVYQQAGGCIMPLEGVFARVLRGGWVKAGDSVHVLAPLPPGPAG